MVIGFKKQFVELIMQGIKVHTIREDKTNRWKPGMTMHMSTGVRTKNYRCFKTAEVVSVQDIEIMHEDIENDMTKVTVKVDGKQLSATLFKALSLLDGFGDLLEFIQWFDGPFKGKIIHWTNVKY